MSFLKKIKKKSGTYVCEVEGYRDEQGGPGMVDVREADEVEVWCRYSRRWVRGFRLAGRRADGSVDLYGRDRAALLPEPLPAHMVRAAGPDLLRS